MFITLCSLRCALLMPFHFPVYDCTSVKEMVYSYLPAEAGCSLFQGLKLDCGTLLLDPVILAFEEITSAVKAQREVPCWQ